MKTNTPRTDEQSEKNEELTVLQPTESQTEDTKGGMLLPAIQKVRESA